MSNEMTPVEESPGPDEVKALADFVFEADEANREESVELRFADRTKRLVPYGTVVITDRGYAYRLAKKDGTASLKAFDSTLATDIHPRDITVVQVLQDIPGGDFTSGPSVRSESGMSTPMAHNPAVLEWLVKLTEVLEGVGELEWYGSAYGVSLVKIDFDGEETEYAIVPSDLASGKLQVSVRE